MTNALSQNIENSKDNALNVMLCVNNTQKQDAAKDNTFSNLVNKLNANIEKTQSNFVDKAVKSNTSSINRFNLDKNQTTKQNNETKIENNQSQPKKIIKINENIQNIDSKTGSNESPAAELKNDCQNNSDLLDINDSSITEPSPVFSSDFSAETKNNIEQTTENATQETQDKNQKLNEIILDVFITLDINLAQNEDLKSEIENIAQNIENSDDAVKAIENAMSLIDNSDLSQEQKDKLNQAFEQVKNLIKTKENTQKSQENLFEDIKTALDDFTFQFQNKIKNNGENKTIVLNPQEKTTPETQNKTDETKYISGETKEIADTNDNKKIEKNSEKTPQNLNDFDEKLTKKDEKITVLTKETQKTLSDKIDTQDNEITLNQDEKKQIENNLKTVEIKSDKISETSDSDKFKAVEDEKAVFETKDTKIENKTEVSNDYATSKQKTDSNKENLTKLTNKILKKIEKFTFSNNEETDSSDIKIDEPTQKEVLSEIVELLKAAEKNNEIDSSEKNKINEIISKINNFQNKTEKNNEKTASKSEIEVEIPPEIEEKVENLISILNKSSKEDNKTELSKNSNESKIETDSKTQDNIINPENKFSNLSDGTKNRNEQNQTIEANFNKNNEKISDKKETRAEKTDFEIDFSKKNQKITKTENTQNQPKEAKINLEKTAFTEKIDEDMLLDIKYSNSTDISGALSVADEVAKMALNEQTSLNPASAVHGSINYDNLSANGTIIKNAAQLMKNSLQNQQLENSDIFKQITNKITQLQNNTGKKLTMVLRPNDLGRLSIELTSNHLGLSANILAQNDDVRAYIEKNIDNLRHQLSNAGVNVNSIQIKTTGQENSANYEGSRSNHSFEEKNNNQNQNSQNNDNRENNQNKKDAQETLIKLTNYDTHFAKDFSNVLNKSLNYNLN